MMNLKFNILILALCLSILVFSVGWADTDKVGQPEMGKIADHRVVNILRLGKIPESAIVKAKNDLHIGYGHTSHGGQVTSGMSGLVGFANTGGLGTAYPNDLFAWSRGGGDGTLDLREGAGYKDGPLRLDCGYAGWVRETRDFLDDPKHSDINVIMWSWCGQVSGMTEKRLISHYLSPMSQLEKDYPHVRFVYMTGHLNHKGTGPNENTHIRNEQIRAFCRKNDKWLFDFADIESYNPDGDFFGDRKANDACDYDSDGNGSLDANWAQEWQDNSANKGKWFKCKSAHTQPLNANQKAYAVWWLWARMAGWNGDV